MCEKMCDIVIYCEESFTPCYKFNIILIGFYSKINDIKKIIL